jgi:hypothetical protein
MPSFNRLDASKTLPTSVVFGWLKQLVDFQSLGREQSSWNCWEHLFSAFLRSRLSIACAREGLLPRHRGSSAPPFTAPFHTGQQWLLSIAVARKGLFYAVPSTFYKEYDCGLSIAPTREETCNLANTQPILSVAKPRELHRSWMLMDILRLFRYRGALLDDSNHQDDPILPHGG